MSQQTSHMEKRIDPQKVLDHFGLDDDPFGKAVSPEEIFYSKRFAEMLRSVEFFAVRGNICAVVGEPGCGKTTFVNALAARFRNNRRAVLARLCLPDGRSITVNAHAYETIANAIADYGVGHPPMNYVARKEWLRHALGHVLAQHGRAAVLVVDEAHIPGAQFYRDLKVLSELEWNGAPVPLGLVLVGEEMLGYKLEKHARNVWKRIEGKNTEYRFMRLDAGETQLYLNRRAKNAGIRRAMFDKTAAASIARCARDMLDINTYAWRAAQNAFLLGDTKVMGRHVLDGKSLPQIKEEYGLTIPIITKAVQETDKGGRGFGEGKVQALIRNTYKCHNRDKLVQDQALVARAMHQVIYG